jgi:Plasmid pRiA4b ORF-3-like protein
MSEPSSIIDVYQLHVWLREITPLIWRRLLVRSDSTIADLHYTLQIAMGWDDAHLHRFRIRGVQTTASAASVASAFATTRIRYALPTFTSAPTNASSMSMILETCGNMWSGWNAGSHGINSVSTPSALVASAHPHRKTAADHGRLWHFRTSIHLIISYMTS